MKQSVSVLQTPNKINTDSTLHGQKAEEEIFVDRKFKYRSEFDSISINTSSSSDQFRLNYLIEKPLYNNFLQIQAVTKYERGLNLGVI